MREGVVLYGEDGSAIFSNPRPRAPGGQPRSADGWLRRPARPGGRRDGRTDQVDLGGPRVRLVGSRAWCAGGGARASVLRDVTQERGWTRYDGTSSPTLPRAQDPAATIQATAETLVVARARTGCRSALRERLEGEALRLARIVSDCWTFPLESGEALEATLAMDELVREEVERAGTYAADAGVALTLDAAVTVGVHVTTCAARAQPHSNAIRYSREGGTVAVTLEREGKQASSP